jgi:hypothetical protein
MTVTGRAAPLPPEQTLYDVTFGAGTFVAVGANGTIFSSVSGGAWGPTSSGVSNTLRAVAYGGGSFVAAGDHGVLLSSPDGVNWTQRSVSAVITSPHMAYGNGRFVVAGKGPAGFWTMLVSTNGADWVSVVVDAPAPVSFPQGMPLNSLTFGAGRFLAVGGVSGGTLSLTSTDGVTWKEQGMDGMTGVAAGPVAFGNGRFVLVHEWYDDDDDDGGPYQNLLSSDDGAHWTWTYSPALYRHQAIVAADCAIVLSIGNPYIPNYPSSIWYSHDQYRWSQIEGIASTINALAFGNGTFVGVGNDIVPLNIPAPAEAFPIVPAANSIQSGDFAAFQAGTPCLGPPVRYQWRHDGVNIPDATNLYLYVNGATAAQAGNYSVVASNASGSLTSMVATLEVISPPPEAPTIISPISDTTNFLGIGRDWYLSVGVTGWPWPTYQWRFNGVDIPGATNSYLPIYNASAAADGDYTVLVSNPHGSALSPILKVVVNATSPPAIFLGEQSFVAVQGSRASFPSYYYSIDGSPPENLRVLKDGVDTGWPIDLFSPFFTLRQAALSDAGQYTIVASNPAGAITNPVISLTVTPGGPLDRWTQRNPLPQNDVLLKVAYGDGQFIAVGDRGAIVSSPDGTNWTSQPLPTEVNLTGVVRDGSRLVAVGGRSVLQSSDGAHWTAALNRGDVALQAVTFANSRFMVVGGDTILTYTDGLGWRDALLTPTAPRALRDVAFGNGRWVAVGAASGGYSEPLWTSANGINWTPVSGIVADFECVIFANGQFLAVGDDGAIFTSPDGLAWTPRNSPFSSRLIGAAYGNGRYVVVGTRGRILSSATGVAWTRETSGTPDRLESVTFGNGLFVAVGENGTTLSSVNGSTWFKRSRGATRDLDGMTIGNGLIAVAGKGGTLLTSSNGSNFVEQSTGVTNDLHGVGWGNGLYVAVGEPGAIVTSPNAIQWTPRTSGSASSLKSAASGGGRWVAVGTQGEILTSTDGTAWARAVSPTANDLNSVAYGNGLFVVVGDNLPPNGTLLTSPDSVHWTRRNQYIGKNLRSVAFVNGVFLATANDGVILFSTNGLAWEQRFTGFHPSFASNLRAGTYAKGTWVLTGNGGFILTSTNASEWVRHIPQTLENLHDVVYFNGSFVTIGNRGTILQSDHFFQPARLAAFRTPSGFALSLTGETGVTYRVEASDRLPAIQWVNIGSFPLSQPTTNFVDGDAGGFLRRFYRAVAP